MKTENLAAETNPEPSIVAARIVEARRRNQGEPGGAQGDPRNISISARCSQFTFLVSIELSLDKISPLVFNCNLTAV